MSLTKDWLEQESRQGSKSSGTPPLFDQVTEGLVGSPMSSGRGTSSKRFTEPDRAKARKVGPLVAYHDQEFLGATASTAAGGDTGPMNVTTPTSIVPGAEGASFPQTIAIGRHDTDAWRLQNGKGTSSLETSYPPRQDHLPLGLWNPLAESLEEWLKRRTLAPPSPLAPTTSRLEEVIKDLELVVTI